MVEFKIASGWLKKLLRTLHQNWDQRESEITSIEDELLVDIKDISQEFIEPDLQPYNPANFLEEEEDHFRVPAFRYLASFIKSEKKQQDGRRHLFILADAGMGKTCLLAMFKLGHVNSFWPKDYECVLMKLGPNTLDRIRECKGRSKTILLLDALDEDSDSFGRVEDRIVDLLKETIGFLRVIITCRTQFFPSSQEPSFQRQDRIKLGSFVSPIKYLSLFNNSQVRDYLAKKVPEDKIERAFEIIEKMVDLKGRPMLLSHIQGLVQVDIPKNAHQLFKLLVDLWLDRECRKKDRTFTAAELLEACQQLARFMTYANVRVANDDLLNDFTLSNRLNAIDIGGRSLLNKNSDGAFRFAHRSFQEFLVIQTLELDQGWDFSECSEMMLVFFRQADLVGKDLSGANLKNLDLQYVNLEKADLTGADLSNSQLHSARLCGTSLKNANLRGAQLQGADLRSANLQDADLQGASLYQANMFMAKVQRANMVAAKLMDANLGNANLKGAKMMGVNLSGVNLEGANLKGAQDINLKGVRGKPKTLPN